MKKISVNILSSILALATTAAVAQTKPAELKVGLTTFLSGPASVFGLAGKAGAEVAIDEINASGGIAGVKLKAIVLDEGIGTDKLLSEYRRIVQDEGVGVALAAVSSGNCNVLAPVAEDLKVVNLLWSCGTQNTLEARRYNFVLRPGTNSTPDMVAAAMYLVRTKPEFKTIAVVNQDYALGRDTWEIFITALRAIKPDVKVIAELFPKVGSTDFSSEISRLQALKPDVIMSATWGGELDTMVRQANQRGLMKTTTWVLPLGESSLERLGKSMPDGVIVGMRGDYYFQAPGIKDDPNLKSFIEKYKAKTGQYPIFPSYQGALNIKAVADSYKAAMSANGGAWPTTTQVADAMHKIKINYLGRTITMREDGQGLQDELIGVTKMTAAFPFPVLQNMELYPSAVVQGPVGTKSVDWAKTLTPALVKDARIKPQ